MKKLGFIVIPLMAVSLLVNCGGSKPEPTKVSYTLTYTYDNGTTDKYVETYAEDKKTEKPTWEPTYPGYTFDGWFTKSGKEGASFTFGDVLTDNTVVFAHWKAIPINHTISYSGVNCKAYRSGVSPSSATYHTQFTWRADISDVFNIVLVPDTDYHLPDSISVLFNGQLGVPGIDYEYKPANKTIAIKKKADASINLTAVPDTPATICTVTFNGDTRCSMFYGTQRISDEGIEIPVPDINPYYVKFSVKTDNAFYMKPGTISLNGGTYTDYSFNKETGDLFINLQEDTVVTAEACDVYKSLEECSWEQIAEISKSGKVYEAFRVGDTKTIKVNNQDHQVRIIGFNEDKDKDNNYIGITFEFVNLISDSNGNSIAIQWNDSNGITVNYDYLNSSIRKALTGLGEGNPFLWAEMGENKFSDTYTDTVLDMLPKDLISVLKAPIKHVSCKENGVWGDKEINDVLFLLSPREMGYDHVRQEDSDHASTYAFYKNYVEETEVVRIKKQVNGSKIYDSYEEIPQGSGQVYSYLIDNCAGFNSSTDLSGGGLYWLRSPYIGDDFRRGSWGVTYDGTMSYYGVANGLMLGVAPAFCI